MTNRDDRDDMPMRGRRQGRGYDEGGAGVGGHDDDYGRNTSGGYREGERGRGGRDQGQQSYGRGYDERAAGRMEDDYSRGGRGLGNYGPDYGRGGFGDMRRLGGRGDDFASGGQDQTGGRGGFGQSGGYGQVGARPGGYGQMGGQGWMGDQGQGGGQYVGRGPKGYRRSDERIREEVCERLTMHGDVDASDIEVQVQDGEVTLSGTVADRLMKRAAADCLEDISGVNDVHNQIKVSRGEQGRAGMPTEQGMLSQQGQLKGKPGQEGSR
jgi:hypothetical protein